MIKVAPPWERGLKRGEKIPITPDVESLPPWERGLKRLTTVRP